MIKASAALISFVLVGGVVMSGGDACAALDLEVVQANGSLFPVCDRTAHRHEAGGIAEGLLTQGKFAPEFPELCVAVAVGVAVGVGVGVVVGVIASGTQARLTKSSHVIGHHWQRQCQREHQSDEGGTLTIPPSLSSGPGSTRCHRYPMMCNGLVNRACVPNDDSFVDSGDQDEDEIGESERERSLNDG